MNQKKKLHPALASLIVIALIGIVASAAIVINAANNNDTANETTHDHGDHDHADHDHSNGATDPATSPESTDTSQYENGTYSATGSYLTPGGRQSIELTVTITDGVITDTSVKNNATDAESREHQKLFSDNYKSLVVGKKVSEVSLSRVSGSSLTSSGFNTALNQIKDDARV